MTHAARLLGCSPEHFESISTQKDAMARRR